MPDRHGAREEAQDLFGPRRRGDVVVACGDRRAGRPAPRRRRTRPRSRRARAPGRYPALPRESRSLFMPAAPTRTAHRPRVRWSAPSAPAKASAARPARAPIATVRAPPPSNAYTGDTWPMAHRLESTTGFPSASHRPMAGTAPGGRLPLPKASITTPSCVGRAASRSAPWSPTTIDTSATRALETARLHYRGPAPATTVGDALRRPFPPACRTVHRTHRAPRCPPSPSRVPATRARRRRPAPLDRGSLRRPRREWHR